jgi:hypothetical protein
VHIAVRMTSNFEGRLGFSKELANLATEHARTISSPSEPRPADSDNPTIAPSSDGAGLETSRSRWYGEVQPHASRISYSSGRAKGAFHPTWFYGASCLLRVYAAIFDRTGKVFPEEVACNVSSCIKIIMKMELNINALREETDCESSRRHA